MRRRVRTFQKTWVQISVVMLAYNGLGQTKIIRTTTTYLFQLPVISKLFFLIASKYHVRLVIWKTIKLIPEKDLITKQCKSSFSIGKRKDQITKLTLSFTGTGARTVPIFVKPVRMFCEAAWRHETRSADLARVEDAGLKVSWIVWKLDNF